jgi:hypothetical protein
MAVPGSRVQAPRKMFLCSRGETVCGLGSLAGVTGWEEREIDLPGEMGAHMAEVDEGKTICAAAWVGESGRKGIAHTDRRSACGQPRNQPVKQASSAEAMDEKRTMGEA